MLNELVFGHSDRHNFRGFGHFETFVTRLASNVSLIDLGAGFVVSQLNVFCFPHGLADPVSHIPGSLVGHTDVAPEFGGPDALLGITHRGDRCEPLG